MTTAMSRASARVDRDVAPSSLAAGQVAGPMFAIVVFSQAFSRDGFDITRHPLSLLAVGPMG